MKDKELDKMDKNLLIERLKSVVWEDYKKIKSCDFKGWYDGLSRIERSAFKTKFDELH